MKLDKKRFRIVIPSTALICTSAFTPRGIVRALNNGSPLNEQEQAIYPSVCVYEHTGLLPGYQSIARYHRDIGALVTQYVNTSGGKIWTISESIYERIIKILRRQATYNNINTILTG